jgi:hypothetical protein
MQFDPWERFAHARTYRSQAAETAFVVVKVRR